MNKILLFLVLFCHIPLLINAQENLLERSVSVNVNEIPLESFLQVLEKNLDIRFSYNADYIPPKKVSVSLKNVSLFDALSEVFGSDYIFRNNGEYVIILKKSENKKHKSFLLEVQGRVFDQRSGIAISEATIYDLSTKKSTLSDTSGRFSLWLVPTSSSLGIRCNKLGYSDSIAIIAPGSGEEVVFTIKQKNSTLSYIKTRQLFELAMEDGRAYLIPYKLISPESRLNSKNVRYFDKQAAQISLIPSIGTNLKLSGAIINHFSINVLAGYSAGVDGFEAGGLLNIIKGDVNGLQVSCVANLSNGAVRGVQMAGAYNRISGSVHGLQLSPGINLGADTVRGVQASGVYNSCSDYINGIQLSLISNHCNGEVSGGQFAAFYNYSRKAAFQLGIVNVCDTSTGSPLGIVNIIKGGNYGFSLSYDELKSYSVNFHSGTHHLYSLLGFSLFDMESRWRMGINFGLGKHLFSERKLSLEMQLLSTAMAVSGSFDTQTVSRVSFSPQFNLKLWNEGFSLSAGPSYITLISGIDNQYVETLLGDTKRRIIYANYTSTNNRFDTWLGFSAGLHYTF